MNFNKSNSKPTVGSQVAVKIIRVDERFIPPLLEHMYQCAVVWRWESRVEVAEFRSVGVRPRFIQKWNG